MSRPWTVTTWFSGATDDATSPIVSSRRSIQQRDRLRLNAIANVVTSITAGDCSRSGRKTTRSIAIDIAMTTAKHMRMLHATGHDAVKASV